MEKIDLEKVIDFINGCSKETKIYIGCDSVRSKKKGYWTASFVTVVVVHIDGNKGCKLFAEKSFLADYDVKPGRPSTRMMNEVYKVTELYLALEPHIDKDIEIHCDINPDANHGSNCAYSQALGYIRGVTGQVPKFKPDAWCASYAADKCIRLSL